MLGLHPFTRGLAFVVFESPLSPLDWGIKRAHGSKRHARVLQVAQALIEQYQPTAVVMEDPVDSHSRKSRRVRRLQRLILGFAAGQAIEVRRFCRKDIRACFRGAGATTRYEIAQAIAAQIDAIGFRLPPARKAWMPEDSRMSLFDAASLVMTYYCQAEDEPNIATAG